ncbi:ADAMTS-like protein 5, partial [Oenanthe melanoleuca]|uniref:ADAMTS-like protein 5 n=1 Tax=Oenanthe melanoleuca TaxID=2939378 RepID=UPI0024C18E22
FAAPAPPQNATNPPPLSGAPGSQGLTGGRGGLGAPLGLDINNAAGRDGRRTGRVCVCGGGGGSLARPPRSCAGDARSPRVPPRSPPPGRRAGTEPPGRGAAWPGGGRGGGWDPRGDPHGAGSWRPWRLLLLAWLSLVGTAQDPALGTPARVPEPPAQPRGTWGSWGPWSSCSSSCGDGVALRSRRCLRTSGELPCTGDPRQYRLCQLQGCPSGSVPFRAMQCSLYDNRPVLGSSARYRWVPFHGAPNLCDLNCLAEGHNFYYSFGRVLDGTRCSPGSPDLCVGGRCLSVGCDGILGSGSRPDACGHCGSGHGSCVLVHRLFQGSDPSSGYLGYVNVTKIPAGATHIKVTDKSRNYLALMASDGRFVLNGDWAIAWPGPYEAAGTVLTYSRAPDGTESLEAAGPTLEELHVMVLLQEPNPGIEYQFWLPRGHPQLGRGDTSPLRQPQPRGAGSPPPPEPPLIPAPKPGGFATEPPPRSPEGRNQDGAAAGRCGRCRPAKGRSQRIRHFCQSDFVFHGRILARSVVGQETRYEVEVAARYRQRFPLVSREYLWVPSTCGCPALRQGGEYLLMARRHVNHEHTLNRILLQDGGYARPWTPREERLVREAARHCPHPRPP